MDLLTTNPHKPMPIGTVYIGYGSLQDIKNDLIQITLFIQDFIDSQSIIHYQDWWEHDGVHKNKGITDLHNLFKILKTPQSLYESIRKDDDVYSAFGDKKETWYLRFYADWDDEGDCIEGNYGFCIQNVYAESFKSEILPKLKCYCNSLDSLDYFQKIYVG